MLLFPSIVSFVLLYAVCRRWYADWQRAILAALVLSGVSVVLITEILSAFHAVTRAGVFLAWAAVALVLLVLWRSRGGKQEHPEAADATERRGESVPRILLALCGLLILIVGVTALIVPPNVWDAMEYHLPRAVLWMSQHSVEFFATPDYAQIVFAPWAEFTMMQLDLLWDSDRLVNFVEFFSYLGCLVGVGWLAKRFGAGRRGQVIAVLVTATIPEGVLEASGPMNTCVVSLWIVATVVFLISWNDEPSPLNAVLIGCAAGLAILTKGSAYVYLPPLVLACWWMGNWAKRVRWLKWAPVYLLCILALNGPQYVRAYELTGSPLGLPFPAGGPRLHWMVDRVSVPGVAANLLRNASLHMATPSAGLNERIEKGIRGTIRLMGEDPDDPKTVWPEYSYEFHGFSTHELHAGNPLHLLLILVAVGVLFAHRRELPQPRETGLYVAGIAGSLLMFCSLLRWQMWGSRHHLPLFVLGSVVVGLALERFFRVWVVNAILAVLLVAGLGFAVLNRTRALIPWSRVDTIYHPRSYLYFNDDHAKVAPLYIEVADFVNQSGCERVAFDSFSEKPASKLSRSPVSFFVYPLMALTEANGRDRTVWYEGVENATSRYAGLQGQRTPCAVICLDCARRPEKWKEYQGVGGRASIFDFIVVFNEHGAIENTGTVPAAIAAPPVADPSGGAR